VPIPMPLHPSPQVAAQVHILNALDRLQTIQDQAAVFGQQPPYVAANLGNLNDLLSKSQTIAAAVSDVAADLVHLAKYLLPQASQ